MSTNKKIVNTLTSMADFLDGDISTQKTRIGLTTVGSELGSAELVEGAVQAVKENPLLEVVLIGPEVDVDLPQHNTDCEEEAHKILEDLLAKKEIAGAVTLHYNFPIGISTVGRVITPAKGRSMYIGTTTGSSSANRVEGMVLNAILGVIAAKGSGIANPTVGILNVDGSRQVDRILNNLKEGGYDINLAESIRSDGGSVMRGNDLLNGSCDVMVCDTLTGNLLMKIFSSYTTGGNYETLGWGYGPGIGKDMNSIVSIVSRASGSPVIKGALLYTYELAVGNLLDVAKSEFQKAEKAGLSKELAALKAKSEASSGEEIVAPPAKPVTVEIYGIDILELDDGLSALWQAKIYAESGMGCAGPALMVAPEDEEQAMSVLKEKSFL